MTSIVSEMYDALRKAGVDEDLARSAAKAVIGVEARETLATKADLHALALTTKADLHALTLTTKADLHALTVATKADLHALESTLTWRMVTVMVAMTALFSAIVKLT